MYCVVQVTDTLWSCWLFLLYRSWGDNLALTSDRVLTYRTGRVGVCLIAAMVYISLVSVDLIVPDWSEENQAEADANVAKDMYYDDDEVNCSDRYDPQDVVLARHSHFRWAHPLLSSSRYSSVIFERLYLA